MGELREKNKTDDAYEHVEKVLEIVSLFSILRVSHDAIMLCVFPITLTGATKRLIDRIPSGTINTWDLLKKDFIQRRISSGNLDGIDTITSKLDSLGRDMKKLKENVHAIQVGCGLCGGTHLDEEYPLNEEVNEVEEVKYGEFGRSFSYNGVNGARYIMGPPGYYTRTKNRPPFGDRKFGLEKTINKYWMNQLKNKLNVMTG
ncbi:hypothetical protein Tco_1027971 [Tanacetum coccineum]